MTPHKYALSDQLNLPPEDEIMVTSVLHEPKGWFCRPKGDTTAISQPVVMWAACQVIKVVIVDPDGALAKEDPQQRIVNTRHRQRLTEIRPMIDLGGGVIGVARCPVELIQPSYVGHGG